MATTLTWHPPMGWAEKNAVRLAGSEVLAWVARRQELLEWLAEAESCVRFGEVCMNYCDGRIVSYEVYHRERSAAGGATEGGGRSARDPGGSGAHHPR